MEKFNKLSPLLASMIFFSGAGTAVMADEIPLSSAETTFNATITDGSCDWLWNETELHFPPVTAEQIKTKNTLIIKPLTVFIQCTQPLTPQLKVTGNTPYADDPSIFIDGSNLRNIGFMLQPDNGSQTLPSLSNFYNEGIAGKAFINNIPFNLGAVTESQQVQQIIWVGLIGMNADSLVVPGTFSASLTITGLIP
ncbi:fimbrial protein [Klebsiella sp. BIGb0407]|uniref:fimbrial protein n=1 Tax=Klebsiella sp. BIGb0407 TaxID=2940603 RepID=UPI002168DB75|nr:fimbrial protein [Klebsiella sp. BIGb0407]MCS3429513.1 type 1 fimbria pilin [Klebsiella sp. BIGb0407]